MYNCNTVSQFNEMISKLPELNIHLQSLFSRAHLKVYQEKTVGPKNCFPKQSKLTALKQRNGNPSRLLTVELLVKIHDHGYHENTCLILSY